MALPAADSKVFQEIIFPELQREEAQALIETYNKVRLGVYTNLNQPPPLSLETNFVRSKCRPLSTSIVVTAVSRGVEHGFLRKNGKNLKITDREK